MVNPWMVAVAASRLSNDESRRPVRWFLAHSAAQAAVVVAGSPSIALAVWMSESNLESAFEVFDILIGLTAGSLGGLFALGVFTRHAHGMGALLGLGVVLGLRFAEAPVTGFLYGFIGFGVCFGPGWLFSLLLSGAGDRSLALGTSD
jgi:solute:Na+ symporter, SSS family